MEFSSACAGPSRNSFLHLFQKHNMLARPPKTDPDIPTDTGHTGTRQKGEWNLYHVVLLGRRDWQKDLGTGAWRELNRLWRGLQGRDWLWASTDACGKEEKRIIKGEAEGRDGEGKGRDNKVNHRRHFI